LYDIADDSYCYQGTTVLKNRLGIREQDVLDDFETEMTMQRSEEPLPAGRFTMTHYRAVHRHLFQDVYPWAGRSRTVRTSKGGNMFCYPEQIDSQLKQIFKWLADANFLQDLSADEFSRKAAHFLAELNAIHAFHEGNGRAQMTFLNLLADEAGHPLDLEHRLDPDRVLNAMIASFSGDEAPLAAALRDLIG
jgi:cell filamentation protein